MKFVLGEPFYPNDWRFSVPMASKSEVPVAALCAKEHRFEVLGNLKSRHPLQ